MSVLKKQCFRLLFAAYFVWLSTPFLHAQHYLFKQFGQLEGLKNLSVRCLTQTKQGFLWIGTENGLFRFDGQNFTKFTTAQGLPSNWIQAVTESQNETLWVGTSAGLVTLQNGIWKPLRQDSPIVVHAQSIASDPKGVVYIAAIEGLLEATWGGDFWKVEPVTGAPRIPTRTVYPDNTQLWFTASDSLWNLNNGQLKRYSTAEGLPSDEEWNGMARDRHGDLYLRSRKSVRMMRKEGSRFQFIAHLPSGNWSDQLSLDSAGELVIPTDEGLRRVDGSWWAGVKNGLPDDPICCTLTDKEDQPWIGTASQGLLLWAGAHGWEGYSEQDGLSGHIVETIHRDGQNRLWVGTRRALNELVGSKLKSVGKAPWLNQIRSVRSTLDGTIWIATLDNGLAALDPATGKLRVIEVAEGFSGQRIVGLDVIGKDLWVYTRQGVFIGTCAVAGGNTVTGWHFRRWTALESFAPETKEGSVYRVLIDRQGRTWAATLAGLFLKDQEKWQKFTWRDRLLEDAVAFMTEDAGGRIWIGYNTNLGVSRLIYENGHLGIEHFTQKNYLTSDAINFVESDRRGWVWVGTDAGVDVWKPNGWRHYGTEDGLIGSNTNFNAFFADTDASIWIGTSRGLSHFDVSQEVPPTGIPAVAMTDMEVDGSRVETNRLNKPLPAGATVKLRFSVLSFSERQHARFRYRLLGLSNQWIDETDGEAVFPNLGWGTYHFQAKAYHPERGWITHPAEVSFQVEPYWWQAPWMIAAAAALLIFGIVTVWRWRVGVLVTQKNLLARMVEQRTAEIRTEKVTVEQQKKQIEDLLVEAQRVNRLKDEFLANISHEIRTPLHGVLGMTSLALGTPLTEEQRDYLRLAEQSARSLLYLLNDILDFSKLQAGRLLLQKIPFSLRECVEKAVGTPAMVAGKKGLEFRVLVADDLPDAVVGDPDRLQQVLSSLANNAAKFTEQGRIQILVFRDPAAQFKDRIHFSVRDTGPGIHREKWSLIFEPFQQVDGSPTRKFGGTGLGLSICSRLVAQMQGELTLDSEVDVGSTFSFFVPLSEPETPPASVGHPRRTALELQPLRVLLVEGNELNLKIGMRHLERQGCAVTTVPSGADALELLEQTAFDLIVIDLELTGMNSLELVREIRSRAKGISRPSLIALTAKPTLAEEKKILSAGADAYLSRPVQAVDLRRVLQSSATS